MRAARCENIAFCLDNQLIPVPSGENSSPVCEIKNPVPSPRRPAREKQSSPVPAREIKNPVPSRPGRDAKKKSDQAAPEGLRDGTGFLGEKSSPVLAFNFGVAKNKAVLFFARIPEPWLSLALVSAIQEGPRYLLSRPRYT